MEKMTEREFRTMLATDPAAMARITPDQMARITPAAMAWITPDQMAARKALWDSVPKVDKLYSSILDGIQSEQRKLDQSTFGPEEPPANICKTPMCIAGHTVNVAGVAGYALKSRYGFAVAAALIHSKSRPGVPCPRYDSYPAEWALAYIETRAEEESK